jgi:predicted ester cyclase
MSIEANTAAVRKFWDGINTHRLEYLDEVCTTDFINHDPNLPNPHADLPTTKQLVGGILAGFPDLHSAEDDLIAAGDKVVVRRTFHGTHTGAFMGIAPTGKKITYTGIFIAHLTGGKVSEQWVNADNLSILQQLGVIPMPG